MKDLAKTVLTAGLAVAIGGAAAATVLAPTGASAAGNANLAGVLSVRPGGDLFEAAASYIGITIEQLRSELDADSSLADIAVAHGKTRDGLLAALNTVSATRNAELVDAKGGPKHEKVVRGVVIDELKLAATYLGLTNEELRTQLMSGKSLAAIAGETAGKSRQGLIDAIVADVSGKLDEAVSAGRISAEQAAERKATLAERIGRLVDATRPAFVGRGPGLRGHR